MRRTVRNAAVVAALAAAALVPSPPAVVEPEVEARGPADVGHRFVRATPDEMRAAALIHYPGMVLRTASAADRRRARLSAADAVAAYVKEHPRSVLVRTERVVKLVRFTDDARGPRPVLAWAVIFPEAPFVGRGGLAVPPGTTCDEGYVVHAVTGGRLAEFQSCNRDVG